MEIAMATTQPFEAINKIITEKIDLVFLDMHMPEMNGIEFVKSISGSSLVILCTAHPQYAIDGYENDVVDYLLKPISYPRFMKAVQKAMNILNQLKPAGIKETSDFMFVKTELKGKMAKITFNEVQYIESMANYVRFCSANEKIVALFTMKEIMGILPKALFVRVHNSYIVNIDLITGIEGNELSLKNGTLKIPIGTTYKEAVLAALKIRKQ
jgi:DNA-binding LytR/AlgR family response regulator